MLGGATLVFYGIYLLFVAVLVRIAPSLAASTDSTGSGSINVATGSVSGRASYQSVSDE